MEGTESLPLSRGKNEKMRGREERQMESIIRDVVAAQVQEGASDDVSYCRWATSGWPGRCLFANIYNKVCS